MRLQLVTVAAVPPATGGGGLTSISTKPDKPLRQVLTPPACCSPNPVHGSSHTQSPPPRPPHLQLRVVHVRPRQHRAREVRLLKVAALQVGIGQVGATEGGALRQAAKQGHAWKGGGG